jgi:membrane protein implicated in regulation of membrane protease activity
VDIYKIYLVCFGVGFCFAAASLLLGEVFGSHGDHGGGSHAGHSDHGGGAGNSMPGFSPVSPTILASFLTAFGGFGVIFTRIAATNSPWLSLPLALIGGLLTAATVFLVFNKIFRATQSSSEGTVRNLVGQSATVITPIGVGQVGEIAYVQGGTRYTAPARSEGTEPIVSGTTVCIIRVTTSEFYVAWL